MEEANIQADADKTDNLYQQGQFPSIITTDDLIFELGKKVIDIVNKEKLLNSLLKKSKITEEQALKSQKNESAILKKFKPLELSNKLYEANNRKLGDELSKIHQETNDLIKQKTLDKQEIKNLKKQLKTLTIENKKLLKLKPKPKTKSK